MISYLFIFPGHIIHLDFDQLVCVLPPGGWDYTTDIAGGAAFREISDICHDSRLN